MKFALPIITLTVLLLVEWFVRPVLNDFFWLIVVATIAGIAADGWLKRRGGGSIFSTGVETVPVGPGAHGGPIGLPAAPADSGREIAPLLTLEVIVLGFEPPPGAFAGLPARVEQPQSGVYLIPLDDELYDSLPEHAYEKMPEALDEFWFLEDVAALLRDLSRHGPVAFVERLRDADEEEDEQRAVVWRGGELVFSQLEGGDTINAALRLVGVQAAPGLDEYATLNLERFMAE